MDRELKEKQDGDADGEVVTENLADYSGAPRSDGYAFAAMTPAVRATRVADVLAFFQQELELYREEVEDQRWGPPQHGLKTPGGWHFKSKRNEGRRMC